MIRRPPRSTLSSSSAASDVYKRQPRGSWTSTATATRDFLPLARPPLSPGSSPPMKVSSTSILPVRRSRPGRTRTDRRRCSMAQTVAWEPISSVRCRLNAETPSFCEANIQQAVNHTVSGVRRRSNRVPAVTEVRAPQPAHLYRPSPTAHPPTGVVAARAHEAVRPAQPLQVVQAVGVGREPGLELPGRPRVVVAGPRLPHVHAAIIVRSAEYPRRRYLQRLSDEAANQHQPRRYRPVRLALHRGHANGRAGPVSYTHLRAHETPEHLVCRL